MLRRSLSYLLPLFLLLPSPEWAQIVNVAPNLATEDPEGFSLELKTSIEAKTGNTDSRSLNGVVVGRFRHDKHHLLFLKQAYTNQSMVFPMTRLLWNISDIGMI